MNILMIGFGSIGQGLLPLLHEKFKSSLISIVTSDMRGVEIARKYKSNHIVKEITESNYVCILQSYLKKGDFVVNVSVNVSSMAMIEYCIKEGIFYIDTSTDPWKGGYNDRRFHNSLRTNYVLREQVLKLKSIYTSGHTTIVITHGANPGLVSHFVKRALVTIAKDIGVYTTKPTNKHDWATLANQCDIKVIHIAEGDSQVSKYKKEKDEFVNTWSVDGFVSECCHQPAELGWGTHEKTLPIGGNILAEGCIYLNRPGLNVQVRSWTPSCGPFHGFLITHAESISISDYLSTSTYRPTVHYAYRPSNDTYLSLHELAEFNFTQQKNQRILVDDIYEGYDELGVLLTGHKKGAYWYGSKLDIQNARKLVPHNNATTLQVCCSVLAGMVWAMENPNMGIVEPEDMDEDRIIELCLPFLGNVYGQYTDWTPINGRENSLFEEDIDSEDPWQFKNVLV